MRLIQFGRVNCEPGSNPEESLERRFSISSRSSLVSSGYIYKTIVPATVLVADQKIFGLLAWKFRPPLLSLHSSWIESWIFVPINRCPGGIVYNCGTIKFRVPVAQHSHRVPIQPTYLAFNKHDSSYYWNNRYLYYWLLANWTSSL